MATPVKKALTFRASSIGDCLMGKYFLENIHAQYPGARCGIVVGSRGSMIRDLLAAYPWIEVIEANRRSPVAVWHLLKRFWRSDIVCTQYTGGTVPLTTKLVARLLAKRGGLVGFTDKSSINGLLYDALLPIPAHRNDRAPRLLEQDALSAARVPVGIEWMQFAYVPQPELLSHLGLASGGYIIVHLFSGADARGLSPARKQALIDALGTEVQSKPLLFVGTAKEREQLSRLRLPPNARLLGTTLQELAALMDQSAGVVALGSGPSHVSSMLGKPTIVLVACQGLQWVGAEQYGSSPTVAFCRKDQCPNGHDYSSFAKCMEAVDMAAVAAKTKELCL